MHSNVCMVTFPPLGVIRLKVTDICWHFLPTAHFILKVSISHVDPGHTHTHAYTLCSAAAEHMSWCGSVQWWKWVDLDINSSSSLSAALIGFDIAQNHLVRAPAACSLLHLKYDWDDHLKCWRACGSASRYTLDITTFIHSFDHCSFL